MKKVIIFSILVIAFVACNVPKDGEQEDVPTSKLEVLTNLGDDTTGVTDSSTKK